jgi:hypothetical protein
LSRQTIYKERDCFSSHSDDRSYNSNQIHLYFYRQKSFGRSRWILVSFHEHLDSVCEPHYSVRLSILAWTQSNDHLRLHRIFWQIVASLACQSKPIHSNIYDRFDHSSRYSIY